MNLRNILSLGRRTPEFKGFSLKKIQEFYEELEDTTPRQFKDLEYFRTIDYNNPTEAGWFNYFFRLGDGIGGKAPNLISSEFKSIHHNGFDFTRQNYIKSKLAEKLKLSVPKIYDFRKCVDKNFYFEFPIILMEDLERKTIDKEFGINSVPPEVNFKFKEKVDSVLYYLERDEFNDLKYRNAIWLPDKKDVVLIDTDLWKFKGVEFK